MLWKSPVNENGEYNQVVPALDAVSARRQAKLKPPPVTNDSPPVVNKAISLRRRRLR